MSKTIVGWVVTVSANGGDAIIFSGGNGDDTCELPITVPNGETEFQCGDFIATLKGGIGGSVTIS